MGACVAQVSGGRFVGTGDGEAEAGHVGVDAFVLAGGDLIGFVIACYLDWSCWVIMVRSIKFHPDKSLALRQTPSSSRTGSDYSIPINLNGKTYYIRLSSTP